MQINEPIFIVSCERISKRQAYYVRFLPNNQLFDRIKNLPQESRKWNSSMICWELSVVGLYNLIRRYKNSTKIHFDFGSNDSRKIFIEQIKKIDAREADKRKFIADLNVKKEQWVKYKKELEETYVKYIDVVHKYLKPNISLYPHQVIAVMFLNVVRNILLALDMGTGKAQDVDSKLLTPNGWVRMGDIKVNDYVIGSDGKPKKVLGVYPQGLKDIYEITFNDGTKARSCDEHIWSVNSPTRIHRTIKNINNVNYPFNLKTLKTIINEGLYEKNNNRKFCIPIIKPIEFEEKELIINPYVLGCILGDGSITTKYGIGFSSIDKQIINEIECRLPINHNMIVNGKSLKDYYLTADGKNNLINQALIKYKLKKCNSHTKFIPDDYKFASINQRLELLQGILDTDGYAQKDGGVELTLASKQLIEDVQYIVQSLGGIARLHDKWIKYKGEYRLYYRLNIKLPPEFIPFKLQRKIDSFIICTKYLPNRAISEIKFLGKKESQCIFIDSEDHLYCTDNCILTHNTIISIAYVEMNDFNKVFVITPNSLKYNYYNEVEKFTNSNVYIIGKKNKCSIEDAKYIITNYEYFNSSNLNKTLDKFKKLNIGLIDALICDESHRLKSNSSNTYKSIKKIFNDDIFRNKKVSKVFMSGTPAPSKAAELYTVLNQISPIEFPTQKYFYEYYCGMKYIVDGYGWNVDEENTKFEELFNKISPFTYRKKKSEVLKDLPEKTYQKILLEMTPEEYEIYYDLEEGVANDFCNKEINNPLVIMGKLREYTSSLKSSNVVELIDSILESNEKFVIIDFFKKNLYKLYDKYKDISVIHTGDQNDIERANAVKLFQDENSICKLFFGSENTTKEGLTLTAASKIGLTTMPWTPGTLDQCTDRVARIGQKNAVNAYLFIYKDTIDEYIFNLIEGKRKEISQVIDGEKYESNIDQSIINDLINIIKEKHGK